MNIKKRAPPEEFDISQDICPERNKPALWSHTVDPEFLFRQIEDYARKRQPVPDLQMVLHGSTLTPAEVDSVLTASPVHRVDVARKLMWQKLERLG